MTTRQIECFFRLADNLSFAKTAEEMFLTQSTVSREIQALEQELGLQLFKRSMKNVRLTMAGNQLLFELRPLDNSFQNALSRVRTFSERMNGNQIRIGFVHTASILRVPDAMCSFREKYPGSQFSVHSGSLSNLNTLFHSGQLDVVFGMRNALHPAGTDHIENLYKGYFCAVVPADHPLYEESVLDFQRINGHDLLLLGQSAAPTGMTSLNPVIYQYCPDSLYLYCSTVKEQQILLSAGIGIALAMQYSFVPSERYRNVPFCDPAFVPKQPDYAVMWHKGHEDDHLNEFVAMVQGLYKQ